MALLDDVKLALRISPGVTVYDSEIQDLIEAAKADLRLSGVAPEKLQSEVDALVKRAIVTYCKAHFGWDNPDAERLQRAYDLLKLHLTISLDYTTGEGE